MDIVELTVLLKEHGVPIETWGRGNAKTLRHLLEELHAGECALIQKDGALLRTLSNVVLNVYHEDGQQKWYLREDRQEFTDGRIRRRALSTSLGEKMLHEEEQFEAAHRALAEELGISEPRLTFMERARYTVGPMTSPSYPGLQSMYTMYPFEVDVPAHLYRPEGYIEHQSDKSTYFVWDLIS